MSSVRERADNMLARKRFCFRVLVDIACLCVVALPVLLINVLVEPFHRGFFCDDQSLMHPFKEDTVPTWLLVVVGMGLPVLCIGLVEYLLKRTNHCCVLVPAEIPRAPQTCVESSYRAMAIFFFGTAITQLLTETGKYSIGRLRPHFLMVCRPQHVPTNCSGQFITENLCTGDYSDTIMKQARLSFPSGHASISMFSAVFIMVYLQCRLVCGQARLVRPVLQVAVFTLALFTCLSRVSDYKHHWSDVLAGSLLGTAVCYLLITCLGDFHQLSLKKGLSAASGSCKERLPMYRQDNGGPSSLSSSSDLPDHPAPRDIQVHVDNRKL